MNDKELEAASSCYAALAAVTATDYGGRRLDHPDRTAVARVLRYLADRFGVDFVKVVVVDAEGNDA